MAADPLKSSGARSERASWMRKLKTERKALDKEISTGGASGEQTAGKIEVLDALIAFGEGRVARYNKKAGGLGRR